MNNKTICELVIRACSQVRQFQEIDDTCSNISLSYESDPRKYFIHNVLNEVEKSAYSVLFCESLFDDNESIPPEDEQLNSKILQSKIDELSMWWRKLVELLVDLIGFSKANNPKYYKHYILLQELSVKTKNQNNQKEYWNCSNNVLTKNIEGLKQEIEELMAKSQLEDDKCWYAKKEKGGARKKKLSNTADRFKELLPKAKKYQKAIIISYLYSYGKPSESLHPKGILDERRKTLNDFEQSVAAVNVLGLCVILAVKDLLHICNVKGPLKQIADRVKKNVFPLNIFTLRTNPNILVGDFVRTPGGLSQVKKINKSNTYGYKSFDVKHLNASGGDQYIAEEVVLFAPVRKIKREVLQILQKLSPGISISHHIVNKAVKEQVIQAYKLKYPFTIPPIKPHNFKDSIFAPTSPFLYTRLKSQIGTSRVNRGLLKKEESESVFM